MSREIQVEPLVSAPFDQVAYVAWRSGANGALVVDPGFETDALERLLEHHGLSVAAILNTHGHADHIAGNARMKALFPSAPLIIGREEAHLLTDPEANLSAPFGMPITSPPPDRLVDDGDVLELADLRLKVIAIPGHSPGSVVFVVEDVSPQLVFGGDVLFAGSVGRADFPGGDARLLISGIREKLFRMPDATLILPGHGPVTTVGQERATNPYVGEGARDYPGGF